MIKTVTALAFAAVIASPALASGFVALEGSDATSFHHDGQYSSQLFKYLKGASSKSVLVYNQSGTFNIDTPTGQTNTYTTTLTGVTLSNYSALYIQTPGTCCHANSAVLAGFGSSVSSFISAGGNLAIGDYAGGSYDGVVPGGAGAVEFGNVSGVGCSDGETVTALGISKGFTQPPVLGCWSHQAYDNTYFSTFGYISLIKSAPAFGFADGSSFLATGGTLGSTAPEPAAWALMLVGFGGVGAVLRRRATKVTYA